jgi:N-acetylmuramoyl-L-alanine amidase
MANHRNHHHGGKKYDFTIVIDPGHGFRQGCGAAYDCGATTPDKRHYEADVVMAQAKAVVKELRSHGYHVVLTRNHDFDAHDAACERHVKGFKSQSHSLSHRVDIAKEAAKNSKEVLFISLHADAAENKNAHGIGVHHAANDADSIQFAKLLAREFNTDKRKDTDAKIKASDFHVLRNSKKHDIEAVLLETGFITNKADYKRISSAAGRKNIAEQIADAVEQYHPIPHPHKSKHAHGKNHHLRNH